MNSIKNATNYNFSHRMLKDNLFGYKRKFTGVLFNSEDEEIEKLLAGLWHDAYAMAKQQKGQENIVKEEFSYEIEKGIINNNLLYWMIKLPEPKYITDCKYTGILYRKNTNEVKYFTLEKTFSMKDIFGIGSKNGSGSYILGGWEASRHLNHGEVFDCDFQGFMDLMRKNSQWW